MTSLLLTLVMLLSLVPAMGVTASAADGFVEVSTYEQLKTAVDKGDAKVKLMANIDTTNENGGAGVTDQTALKFIGDKNILDLNGYTLKLVSNTGATFFEVLKSLTIKDSSTGGRIDFEWGSSVLHRTTAIHVADASTVNLTVESGTLSSTYSGVTLIKSEGNLTINGGKFYAPYREGSGGTYAIHTIHQYNDNAKTMITGGEIDGVVFIQRDDSAATGTPNYGDIPVQIKGGTFKQAVLFRWTEKGKPSGDPTEFSPAVEIAGGIFEKRVNGLTGIWGEDLSTKLTGGTFKDFPNRFGLGRGGKSDHEYYSKSLGNSIIMRGNEIRTSCDWSEADWFKVYFDSFYLDGSESTPVTVIPNAWGIIDVTLDGDEINYAKNWNGAAVEITNGTAHTITFTWKSLAQELKDAKYSYDAKCEHYISGSTAVQETENIAAGKTSHTITIEKGADPKVYSFDLKLNLEKNGNLVGIVHNQHIVKLVVKPAEVPKPDPTIDGTVYYTSGIVYGSPISISASVTPVEATKSYQWQRSTDGGRTWTDIDGATSGKYTPVAADMGKNIRIRVKVTAEGYLGEIVGAPLKVNKAANDDTPTWPNVVAQTDDNDAYTKFEITNYNREQEYVYTTSAPTSGSEWPDGGKKIDSSTVTGLTEGETYYIYTRYKGTDTHQPGSKIIISSVLMDEITKLNRIILTDDNDKEYSSYGSGNTIYIQKDTSLTLTATTNPDGANTWSKFTFKPLSSSSSYFSVTEPTDPVDSGSPIPSVTIRGDKAGTDTLAAEYSGLNPQYYGTWGIHVYEDVSEIGTSAEITVSPSFPDMTMYVGETMPLPDGYTVDVYPEGALDNYDLAWRIVKVGEYGASYKTSDDNITLENGKIEATKAHAVSENTRIALVAINKKDNNYISSLSDFYVTVTAAPVIALTDLIVVPARVNLEKAGDTFQLSAVRQPANATGDLEWTSDKPAVAEVDNTGKVTAVAKGEATITVTCGDKKATCTVLVDHTHNTDKQDWVYMDPGTHIKTCTAGDDFKTEPHKFSAWTDNKDDKTHTGTCTECGYEKTENHSWVVDHEDAPTANAEGTRYYKCSATGCTATKTESIPMLTEYSVTVNTDGNGTASASPATAVAGTEITLSAKAKSGYHFKEWQVVSGGVTLANETSATTTFIMPATDVEIEANFEKNASTGTGTGATTYPITVKSAKNGDVTASHKSASKGTTVTLTVDPDKGYVLDTLTVLDGKDKELKLTEKNGKYTFTMPDSKVTVAAAFKPLTTTGKHPFTDVPAGAYYEDAVVWAVGKNITTGMSAAAFDPNGSCTRAQIVTFLWRAAGSPEPKTMKGFDDVASKAYYAKAVAWAVENGITTGTSASKFSPNDPCTRTQAVTFLFRYAAANGMEAVTMQELLSGYADAASVPSYAVSAMNWALAAGILQGDGVKLMPNATCTRAQIVTFIYRSVK